MAADEIFKNTPRKDLNFEPTGHTERNDQNSHKIYQRVHHSYLIYLYTIITKRRIKNKNRAQTKRSR